MPNFDSFSPLCWISCITQSPYFNLAIKPAVPSNFFYLFEKLSKIDHQLFLKRSDLRERVFGHREEEREDGEEKKWGHSRGVCVSGFVTEVHTACSSGWHLSLLINNTLKPLKTPRCRSLASLVFLSTLILSLAVIDYSTSLVFLPF